MTLYWLLDTYGEGEYPEYGLSNDGTMYWGHVEKVTPDYQAGLKAQWDASHGWTSLDDDDLRSFTVGANVAFGIGDNE